MEPSCTKAAAAQRATAKAPLPQVLLHREFLSEGELDPRPELATSLLACVGDDDLPICVYSSFESRVIGELAAFLPDSEAELRCVQARLVDLLPIVRAHVYHPRFNGSFSIKSVAPALCPGFDYADLEEIREGSAAAAAYVQIASGALEPAAEERARKQLLSYCERDTLALVELCRALRALAPALD